MGIDSGAEGGEHPDRENNPYQRDGLQGVVQALYNRVRPHLPRKMGVYNGVHARGPRLFDVSDVLPDYEDDLLGLVREAVDDGDHVTLVGGGLGISTIVAARQGAASLTVYEPAADRARLVAENAALHDVQRIEVHHAAVGDAANAAGPVAGADRIIPADLPDGDVLVLDCEGAEVDIITEMPNGYRVVVVETHGALGTSKDDVHSALETHDAEVLAVSEDNPAAGIYTILARL
ncbi:hypothetical protein [Haloarcula pellucida]|uniref:FkbM family methyltransferase n=1 Tax=Haloarcula pellucida TaxID=1427151 RepID=A0A830GJK8_9EURY|nr:hypothetical protein [Halomicroarcula pellucida]MBX0347399.1 hypothetical protein [Halomicroarcula pellucida]GGN88465.1 hypothetical protein GCM10009030_08230 [Halomicroarcula pellucida]